LLLLLATNILNELPQPVLWERGKLTVGHYGHLLVITEELATKAGVLAFFVMSVLLLVGFLSVLCDADWSPPLPIGGGKRMDPMLGVNPVDQSIHVIANGEVDGSFTHTWSTDGGRSWSHPIHITNTTSHGKGAQDFLLVFDSKGTAHTCWRVYDTPNAYCGYKLMSAETWSASTPLGL
jgi:hypothetical protein